jgi:hypothetical protein
MVTASSQQQQRSVLSSSQHKPWRFWTAVRTEMRVTWLGRTRWLWAVVAAAGVAWLLLEPGSDLSSMTFTVLCGAMCWLPAWLCADLLALRFSGNPDPLREWRPAEFAARAVGRLVPAYVWLLVCALVYIGRCLLSPGSRLTPLIAERTQFLAYWWAYTVVWLLSGVPYALGAALFSGMSRRPRPWLVTPFVLLFGTLLVGLICGMPTGPPYSPRMPVLDALEFTLRDRTYYLAPNRSLGGWGAATIYTSLCGPMTYEPDWHYHFTEVCWWASAAFGLLSVPLFFLVWRVTAVRYRRHPCTAAAEHHD